jgi:type IV pilus assembly protein PilF
VLIVSKFLRLIILTSSLLIQACQHPEEDKEITEKNKPDLSKAASFNMQLGLGYLKQGQRPRAKKKLLTALKQEPNSPDINAAMAYYLEQTNDLDAARKYYLKAISLSANSGAQLNNYGSFLCKQGEYKKADEYFIRAIKDTQYINTAGAYENAGLCALAAPENEKAKYYFKQALSQDPSKNTSLYEWVKLENKEEHNDKVLELLQEHPDLVLNDPIFLDLAKNAATKAGKYEMASEYEHILNKLKARIDNSSGANNEYNSRNG